MIVAGDFRLSLDEQGAARILPSGLDRPGLQRRLARTLEELQELVRPAACYESFVIERVLHERLELAGGTRIGSGQLTTIVGGAEELYVAVCTLGGELDDRIREHRAQGRFVEMLLLDELGSWAIDQVREQLYGRIQAELAGRGWRASSPLSPGESSWPMREQRIIFRLLDVSQIDVTLGAGDLMRPQKSLSMTIGAGSGELGAEGLTRCHYCSIRERCRFAVAS
jgi:hypothetical protein